MPSCFVGARLQVARASKRFGDWHTFYVRMNRWSRAVPLTVSLRSYLQLEQIVRIKIEAFSLDSTSVKVHPDGAGAFKKRPTAHGPLAVSRRVEYQDSSGCRGYSNGYGLLVASRQRSRCSCWPRSYWRVGRDVRWAADVYGFRIRRR